MKIGLRVDVDTLRGTRAGAPALCRIFKHHKISASFFFSVGPDNMGRHLWRMVRPAFFTKMLRSRAGKLYGWDILLRGTAWPGPLIGKKCAPVIRAAAEDGHEIGLHAWDHHRWQARIGGMRPETIRRELQRGYETLSEIISAPIVCSAVPGWKCTDDVLAEKKNFPFAYNSDCRGHSVFMPRIAGRRLGQPQVPVTLPTYDEAVGQDGVTSSTFGDHVLGLLKPGRLNVLTIHAEAEGIALEGEFRNFVAKALALGHEFAPLGMLVGAPADLPDGVISEGFIPGREGWVSLQNQSLP
ncbi:MAG: 4-deoxy-4-formamido-L-arabinose-phosphoundecaprenol deformylase [Kiritimatiellia bacterium]